MKALSQLLAEIAKFASRILPCRYGENAWQKNAALLTFSDSSDPLSLGNFAVIEGAAPSYNNWADVDRLLQTITHIASAFDLNYRKVPFIAVGGKHGNACGAAVGNNKAEVLKKMMAGDPMAIFGGLIITNFEIDESVTGELEGKMLDGVICPSVPDEAIAKLRRKGDKCRFIVNIALEALDVRSLDAEPRFRYVRGGYLSQPNYTFIIDFRAENISCHGATCEDGQDKDLLLAWAIGSTSNSNTITLVKDGMLLGNGVGQQDRVGAANLAVARATRSGHSVKGASAYSDSFFPFKDGPQVLVDAGITAILTSSGSVKDKDTIGLCQERKVALLMIPDAEGRGFFGH